MIWLRRIFWVFCLGFLLGVVAASLVAPPYLAWDNTPRSGQALCNCVEVVDNTTRSLLKAQLLGGSIGASMGIIGLLIFALARRKPATEATSTPPPK